MSIPNAAEILVNLNQSIPALIRLTTAVSYVGGMYLIVTSVMGMKDAALLSTPNQHQTSMWSQLRKILVGAGLLYLPSTVSVATITFFGDTSPLAYVSESNQQYKEVYDAALSIIYLIGTIAVIKGLYVLSDGQTSQKSDGSHHSSFAKGFTFIFAGALCINLHATITIITNTLGITGLN